MHNWLGEYSQEKDNGGSRIDQGRKLNKDVALSGVELQSDPMESSG